MKIIKAQVKVQKNSFSHSVIINLGSATTLTLGTRGGNTEGRRQNWY